MKKIITLAITALLITVLAISVSAEKVTEFKTSSDDYGFTLKITDKGIDITGRVSNEKITGIGIITDDPDHPFYATISPNVTFSLTINLPKEGMQKLDLDIYLGEDPNRPLTSIFYKDIILEKIDGKWYFTVDDNVYNNNVSWLSGWVKHEDYLNTNQPSAVKMVTSSAISGAETKYDKAFAIHKWIVNNIYYDEDYALGAKDTTSLTPTDVLTTRVSVCEGYSNLAVAMLNSAGIPAITVKGFSLGVGTDARWIHFPDNVEANHMWVEAYIDGRWIIMDPTWDCRNEFLNGAKKPAKEPYNYRYFDISPFMLSSKHKILDRPNVFGKMGVSTWADAEVKEAYKNGLITEEIMTTMKNDITRREFCNLVVNLLSVKLDKPIDTILSERSLTINNSAFADTSEYNILCANALGIVNGKENQKFDPDGKITRDEAAAMLQRTAKVLGATNPNGEKYTFADADKFQTWAVEGIDFVSASVSKDGKKVMGGVENNCFAPKGLYTKEQSVLTIIRLFNTY